MKTDLLVPEEFRNRMEITSNSHRQFEHAIAALQKLPLDMRVEALAATLDFDRAKRSPRRLG